MCAAFYYEKNGPNFAIGGALNETTSLTSLPFTFDRRHYKKDSRFVNDLYTLTYDEHESLDSVRLFSTFANQVSEEEIKKHTNKSNKLLYCEYCLVVIL